MKLLQPKPLLQKLLLMATMNLVALLVISGLILIYEEGFGQWYREIAYHMLNRSRGVRYLILLAAGSVAYELIARLLIQRITAESPSKKIQWAGIVACGALLGLSHLRVGIVPSLFGLLLGLGLAWQYQRSTRPATHMIWQLQWQYALLPLSLIVAMAFDSESRTQFLWAYKLRNIEEGKLHYREGWGWVDDSHYHDHRLKELLHKIETAPAGKPLTITIHEPFVTIIRKWLPVERKYEIFDPKKLDEQERWAVASGISLHFSNENELAQGAVPSWMCSQMSVYQFDDLPTTLLTCLDKAPRQSPTKVPIGEQNIERLIERWDAEGDNLVRSNHQQLRLPEEASQEHQRLFGQIHLSNEHWRFAGIGKGDYSMVR